ncbi:DUF5706 domain-containing protein [Patescibacteria group bacterium]|nr:DUF5706 domain-containing protein [Patescibacteria group bacterium]
MNSDKLKENLFIIQDWIKSADQKVSIWFAFEGIFLTFIMGYFFDFLPSLFEKGLPFQIIFALLISSILVLIGFSAYKSICVIFPRIKNNGKKSLLYFGDIGKMTKKEFNYRLKNYSEKDYRKDLISQIYISSSIAIKKHRNFRDSIICFVIGFILLFVYFIIMI